MNPSGVVHNARTSEGMFFPTHTHDKKLKRIDKRIADLTNIPRSNGEGLQVLRYRVGEEYKPHFYYFNVHNEGGRANYERGGQRLATVIMYLNDTPEGGATIFPRVGVDVKPIKGNAVLFYSCLPHGAEDPLSFHGGAPVLQGEKWIATKWLREEAFH